MFWTIVCIGLDTLSNTLLFLSHQTVQVTNMKMARNFFRSFPWSFLSLFSHHLFSEVLTRGLMLFRPAHPKTLHQRMLMTAHPMNKCLTVSFSVLQKTHIELWGRPLLASLSTVHILLLNNSHRKNLILSGALDSQIARSEERRVG